MPDLVGRIRNGETPPFRPKLPDDINVDTRLIQLMASCWDEDPSRRPSISSVKSTFFNITKGRWGLGLYVHYFTSVLFRLFYLINLTVTLVLSIERQSFISMCSLTHLRVNC